MTGNAADVDHRALHVKGAVADLSAYYVTKPTATPTDGQLLAWSAALGQWTPVAPSGSSELASAINTTGTVQSVAAPGGGGLGTAVVLTGTAISVGDSGGRPVTFHFGGALSQISTGLGVVFLAVQETTSGAVNRGSSILKLPNVIVSSDPADATLSAVGQWPAGGAIVGTRTFQLTAQVYSPTGSAPTVNTVSSTAFPTFLRAVAG